MVYALAFTIVYVEFPEYFAFFVATFVIGTAWLILRAFAMISERGVPRASRVLALTTGILYPGVFLALWLPEHFFCEYVIYLLSKLSLTLF